MADLIFMLIFTPRRFGTVPANKGWTRGIFALRWDASVTQ
jgi:hypothetical protein